MSCITKNSMSVYVDVYVHTLLLPTNQFPIQKYPINQVIKLFFIIIPVIYNNAISNLLFIVHCLTNV